MTSDRERARALLESEGFTCVIIKEEKIFTSRDRGVKPLLEFLDSGVLPSRFSAADRVVGAAAAYLYVLLGAAEVHAGVLSRPAAEVFDSFGTEYSYDTMTDAIINRAGDGLCPMESAVAGAGSPREALARIRRKLTELKLG